MVSWLPGHSLFPDAVIYLVMTLDNLQQENTAMFVFMPLHVQHGHQ